MFNLTETTLKIQIVVEFREAQLSGFKFACDAACGQAGEDLLKINSAIPQTIEKMFDQYMSVDDANVVKGIINKEIYHLSSPKTEDAYTLANIMRGRLQSLIEIQLQMKKNSVSEISGQRFRFMLDSQYRPSGKCKRTKSEAGARHEYFLDSKFSNFRWISENASLLLRSAINCYYVVIVFRHPAT